MELMRNETPVEADERRLREVSRLEFYPLVG